LYAVDVPDVARLPTTPLLLKKLINAQPPVPVFPIYAVVPPEPVVIYQKLLPAAGASPPARPPDVFNVQDSLDEFTKKRITLAETTLKPLDPEADMTEPFGM
jgi:hypothetical protein